MYTLSYNNNKAAIVRGDRYIYEFNSLEEARKAVAAATEIVVIYQPGNRSQVMEITPAVKQSMRVIPPTSYPVE